MIQSEKAKFIMSTQEEVQEKIKETLKNRMAEYKDMWGFTDDDVFMWLACDIKYSIASQGAKLRNPSPHASPNCNDSIKAGGESDGEDGDSKYSEKEV